MFPPLLPSQTTQINTFLTVRKYCKERSDTISCHKKQNICVTTVSSNKNKVLKNQKIRNLECHKKLKKISRG